MKSVSKCFILGNLAPHFNLVGVRAAPFELYKMQTKVSLQAPGVKG